MHSTLTAFSDSQKMISDKVIEFYVKKTNFLQLTSVADFLQHTIRGDSLLYCYISTLAKLFTHLCPQTLSYIHLALSKYVKFNFNFSQKPLSEHSV